LSWILFDVTRGKKVSALGFCIGAVVGLVANSFNVADKAIGKSAAHD
jgi:ammonia channel protein AmtB